MMDNKRLFVGLLGLALLTLPLLVSAVPLEDSYDGRAEGTLIQPDNGRSESVIYATVDLRQSGDFDVSVRTDRGRAAFSGRWRERDTRTATLTVTDGAGRRLDGTGTAQYSGDRLQRLSLTSRDRDDDWRLSVTLTNPVDSIQDPYARDTRRPVSDRTWKLTATGNMTVLVRRLRVESISLKLRKNGEVVLDTKGGYGDTFTGTWIADNRDQGEFRITNSKKLGRLSGTGSFTVRGSKLRSVEFSARNRDGRVSLTIPASRPGYDDAIDDRDIRPDRPTYNTDRPVYGNDSLDYPDALNRGSGTMNIDGMDERIERVVLDEMSDRLTIRVYTRNSSRTVQFEVDVSSTNSGRVSGDLTRVSTLNGRTSGAVSVRYDRARRVAFLEIRGRVDQRPVTVSFRGD